MSTIQFNPVMDIGSSLEPPAEEVLLPSRGVFYNDESTSVIAKNDGKILVRPITFREEQLMVSPRIIKTGQVVSALLRECVKTPNVDVDNLLSADRMFLFYYLRSISYGPEYEYSAQCPHCSTNALYVVDLSSLDVVYADPNKDREPIDIYLPVSKRHVKLRYSRGYDENIQIQKMVDGGEYTLIDTLVRLTVDIDGIPQQYWYKFYENLSVKDSYALKTSSSGRDIGIKTNTQLTCKSCGQKFDSDVPITANFFRPKLS